ncbi:MAG: hypothetical protein WA082_02030 [Candidatus Moraniibacteriota bacterium]
MRSIILFFLCLFGLVSQASAITEMTPPYAIPYTAHGNVYDRYFTYYDAPGSIQYVYVKQGYNYHNFDLYYYWAGQTIVVKNVGGATFGYNTLLVQCEANNTNCFEWSTYGSVMGVPASCATPPIRSTFDLYWGNTAMPTGADPLFCSLGFLSANQKFVSANIVPAGPAPSYLSFPLAGYTAYTAPVSSVMDHSMTSPYAEDNTVLAFNGERGDRGYGFSQGCYKKSGGGDFGTGFNYVGTTGTGGKPYFCYDGHPGYDYPQVQGTDILAPAAGKLCVATAHITQQSPANVWRNPTECGAIPSVVTEAWSDTGGFNAFYIFHTEYINGATNDYMTVFLHSNNLENTVVWSTVASQGYANVTRGQHIADVGSVGAGSANHIHLEVYKEVSGNWTRVDPYGDGTNNILWQH